MIAQSTSAYLYAITAPDLAPDLSGLPAIADETGPRAVEYISDGPFGMVLSSFLGRRIRPERKNLAAHQAVLRALMSQRVCFLPVAFGVIVPSRGELLELLHAHQAGIAADLEKLSTRVEMGLRVTWDVPNIFEFFVARNPELAHLRDRVLKRPGGVLRSEMIAVGQKFEALLNAAREQALETLKRALLRCVMDFRADPARGEKMIVNLACLIERDQEKAFEQAVLSAASSFDDHYAFDYNGPWPPFHFVSVSLPDPVQAAFS